MERSSGVLLHVSSLPSKYGIGSFGEAAYDFVDFLVETGQTYWQILPLTTTSYGDSPYSSYSAFAGNTNFINLDLLIEEGFITKDDVIDFDFGDNPGKVDYVRVEAARRPILEKAVEQFVEKNGLESKDFKQFVSSNESWLISFSQFMTVKENNDAQPWYEWEDEFRLYDEDFIIEYCEENIEQVNYHLVTQYWFSKQWFELKDYANRNNILIIGDIPIYVARDSVEMWSTPHLFLIDEDRNPMMVAGVPPDSFSDDGQYWGNPIYDWEYMEKDKYKWWVERTKANFELYDVVRIDHFRGFESYWAIPFGSETAAAGMWEQGPDVKLFNKIKEELGELNIIAEDLGFITEEVIELRDQTGFPGMKILQHGFSGEDSLDLMHHYTHNTIAYVGTHDNSTALEWYLGHTTSDQRDQVDMYLNRRSGEHPSDALNRGVASSPSRVAIYTMQDLLRLGPEGRMNIPSTIGNNWDWRMTEEAITVDLKEKLLSWTETYFRMNDFLTDEEDAEYFEDTEKLIERTENDTDKNSIVDKKEI